MSFSFMMRLFKHNGFTPRTFVKEFGKRPTRSGNIEDGAFLFWCYNKFYASQMDFKDFLWKHTLLPLELFFNNR